MLVITSCGADEHSAYTQATAERWGCLERDQGSTHSGSTTRSNFVEGMSEMRGSDLYNRYIDTITAIAKEPDTAVNWTGRVETLIRQFQSETMPLMRAPFRKLRDDMTAELKSRSSGLPDGRAREVLSFATTLISTLK